MPSHGSNDHQRERDSSRGRQNVQPPPPPTPQQQQRLVKKYRTEVAASMSSVLSTATAFPLDSVKTRMQTYKYAGFLDCVRHTYNTEKLRGFFRGMMARPSCFCHLVSCPRCPNHPF